MTTKSENIRYKNMNTKHQSDIVLTNQRGIAAIMVALVITVLLGMAALAIDIGYRNVAQNEIQNIADAAALAGAGELGRQYSDPNFEAVDEDAIRTIAQSVANSNESGFSIEVQIGTWRTHDEGFIGTLNNRPNAVKATARRGSDGNSQIPTFFARIWNIVGLNAKAVATAALTGSTEIDKAKLEIPVGISYEWFQGEFCDHDIQFYPTAGTAGCAGWHVYDSWPANAQKLRDDILGRMLDGTWNPTETYEFDPTCPDETNDGNVEFAFTGGNLSTTQDNIAKLFDVKRYEDGDGDDSIWTTKVVVYCEPCGDNPNQTVKIIGVATVKITGVVGPPPVLTASIECGQITPGQGGGSYYGTWGSIPGLVE